MDTRLKRPARIGLIAANLFLGVTAVAGGLALLLGWIAPGLELLEGSPFTSYTIPGLALLALVGGSALLAGGAALRRAAWGPPASVVAAAAIIIFEGVEIAVIGYHWLQAAYLAVGVLIAALAALLWWLEPRRGAESPRAVARPGAA